MPSPSPERAERLEWLETDGRGGFTSGTAAGIRTRRYHALLLSACQPPTRRMVLVNGLDAVADTPAGKVALTSQVYSPGVVHPDGQSRIVAFTAEPWPTWTSRLAGGRELIHEVFVCRDVPLTALRWRLRRPAAGFALTVRPFLSGRDMHDLHHENPVFDFHSEVSGTRVLWHPYPGVPGIVALANGSWRDEPYWYRNFFYRKEQERGLECREDLAAPGAFRFDLASGDAVLLLAAEDSAAGLTSADAAAALAPLEAHERRRRRSPSRLQRAAPAYLVRRGAGRTVIAGYPWFADWGRDTAIALRGLCLATGRLAEAREVLLAWAGALSQGMLPNRFPESGEAPEYNSVDAALWFVVAAGELLEKAAGARRVTVRDRRTLQATIQAILEGYAAGTRHGIRAADDGLLAAGAPGVQLTWMDARVGDRVVTPRCGKPVEVQALWLNALAIGGRDDPRWGELLERGRESFTTRFWNEARGYLYDVVDVDHQAGAVDAACRPNQILAVGGLPLAVLEGERARRVVEVAEARLLTPLGLRSLAADEPGYVGNYRGGPGQRDAAYHQGTVWPWLLGPFVEAWVRVREDTGQARRAARERFLAPLLDRLEDAGLGHLPEIADGDPPHTPRGCPFQAWSVGEALRLDLAVLAEAADPPEGGA
jgi:predicted glycogen debranching enzyme